MQKQNFKQLKNIDLQGFLDTKCAKSDGLGASILGKRSIKTLVKEVSQGKELISNLQEATKFARSVKKRKAIRC